MLKYDAYQPYTRLVKISLVGKTVEVPENNVLLRCFQFIAPQVPYGPWCWNGDCESDPITFRLSPDGQSRKGLSCQTLVAEGMEILEISADLRRVLASVLDEETETVGTS